MTNTNFTMTKTEQKAEDFGLQWFPNGASKQMLYTVVKDGKIIKQHISTKYDQEIYAIIIMGNKAENGVAIVPAIEVVYEVKFSTNPNKKYGWGTRQIVIKTNQD